MFNDYPAGGQHQLLVFRYFFSQNPNICNGQNSARLLGRIRYEGCCRGVELASSSHIVRIHYTYFYETHSRTPNSNDLFVPSFAFGGGLLCKFTGSKCPKVDFTELVEREGI